eukprot:4360793-Lingulodinium_polyedra.AAC.1
MRVPLRIRAFSRARRQNVSDRVSAPRRTIHRIRSAFAAFQGEDVAVILGRAWRGLDYQGVGSQGGYRQ